MVRIEVNEDIAKQLRSSNGSIEVIDARGQRLGRFIRPEASSEVVEARRRSEQEEGGLSLDKVWEGIHARHPASN